MAADTQRQVEILGQIFDADAMAQMAMKHCDAWVEKALTLCVFRVNGTESTSLCSMSGAYFPTVRFWPRAVIRKEPTLISERRMDGR